MDKHAIVPILKSGDAMKPTQLFMIGHYVAKTYGKAKWLPFNKTSKLLELRHNF